MGKRLTGWTRVGAIIGIALFSTVAAHAATGTSGPAGGSTPLNNVQPAQVVGYIIATQGIFPNRDGASVQGVLLGEVRRFAGTFAPSGWAFCDGQLLSIATNQALFSLLGTTYGGNGINTFALPDLRGRTPLHAGQGPGLANRVLGESTGQESVTLFAANNPAHLHPTPLGPSGLAGNNQPIENMMPSLALNFIISVSAGAFPARDGANAGTFLAEVRMFAGNFAPAGWAFTSGQILSISTNTALFSLLGTMYGGDGRTTFALPDLRGRAPIGVGNGPGLSPQFAGQISGEATIVLTEAQLPPHVHTIPTGGTTSPTGGGQPHTNMQPTLALTPIIAVTGTFPPQNGGSTGDNFLAEVRLFAGNFVPAGWAAADGALAAIANNEALFSLIGTVYGGNGQTTLAFPDLRGRVAVHRGQGPGLTNRAFGQTFGTETELVALSQMAVHTHVVQLAAGVPALSQLNFAFLVFALTTAGAVLLRRARRI